MDAEDIASLRDTLRSYRFAPTMPEFDRQSLLGAAIVSVAIIAGSVILSGALNGVTEQLDRAAGGLEEIRSAVVDAKEAVAKLPSAGAPRPHAGAPIPTSAML